MFTIYQQIANRLRAKLPALHTIDYDKGQLADPEKAYPLDYPAVLISLEDIVWKDEGKHIQRGTATIAVTVALLPTEVSLQNSPTINSFVEKMNLVNLVYTSLKGYRGGETITVGVALGGDPDEPDAEPVEVTITGASFTGLTRTRTQRMKRYDTIQAFTHLFTTSFADNSAQPVYVKPPEDTGLELKVHTPNTVINFPEELG